MRGDDAFLADTARMVDEEPPTGADDETTLPWLGRLCRAATRHLPASGAAVSLVVGGGMRGVAVASDPLSVRLDEMQFLTGEGPCLDAFGSRQPVLEPDLPRSVRWPGYAPVVVGLGVGAVFAFPLQVGASRLGVLDVYRAVPGPLSDEAVERALCFAELAVDNLLDTHREAPERVGPELAAAVGLDAHVYQAQGMVMVDLGVTLEEAMVRMRAHAYAHDRRLTDVARDIVGGRLVLEADQP